MNTNINDLTNEILKENLENIAPNYRKGVLTTEEVNKIIDRVANDIEVDKQQALTGIILLMLKGAASDGTPHTLVIDLKNGKKMAKRNVLGAYVQVTGNTFLRRLAEALAIQIGVFAEHFELPGELAQRINTSLKAKTGEILSKKESAWCSSFSQNIPDLAERSSERLVQLLAEDYKKRFEHKKKEKPINMIQTGKSKKGKKHK